MATPRKTARAKTRRREKTAQVKHCVLCDGAMGLVTLRTEGVESPGYRCRLCGNEVVTLDQMKAYAAASKLRDILPSERKIVRLGNSIGITLPKSVARFGLEPGSTVRITYVTESGFYIEPVSPPKKTGT